MYSPRRSLHESLKHRHCDLGLEAISSTGTSGQRGQGIPLCDSVGEEGIFIYIFRCSYSVEDKLVVLPGVGCF